MSTPPSAQPPPQSKSRKKRSADVVSFEDLLAAHKTERGPGQLPPEGVVLIGVDLELQRRMAEQIGLSAFSEVNPSLSAPKLGAPAFESPPPAPVIPSAPSFSAPYIGTSAPPGVPEPSVSIEHPSTDERPQDVELDQIPNAPDIVAPNSGAPTFDDSEELEFDLRDLLIRRTRTKSYVVHPVSRIEDVFTPAERDLLKWLWERGRVVPISQRIRLLAGPNGGEPGAWPLKLALSTTHSRI